jgi:ketosteroid isomerase-like protein
MELESILQRFAAAVAVHDTPAFAALFTPDGSYDDYFFGRHQGRDEIAAMLDRFHVGGEAFCWQFDDPVQSGDTGYATYCFSYRSREPGSAGELVVFEGIARLRLRDGLIAGYAEVFDRGTAFVQLRYPDARIRKLLERYAAGFRAGPVAQRHLELRAGSGEPA